MIGLILVADLFLTLPQRSAAEQGSEAGGNQNLQEVIVTAQKREERLQDVPMPVGVVNTESLTENNQVRIADYYMEVPGLSIAPTTIGNTSISIRGIGGIGATTVGIMIDDIPFGLTGNALIPDLDPGDLARIEVLRGPQGTLYGSSSMGGLIKFVTKDPSSEGVVGRLEAGTEGVQNGVDPGYTFRGSVSAPLVDGLSASASAYVRRDAGYIDNPVYNISTGGAGVNYPYANGGRDGVNQAYASGGHLAVLWRPDDSYSLKLSALYQTIRAGATNNIIEGQGLGDLQQNFIYGGTEYDRSVQAYSAIFTSKIGHIDFTSATGYNVNSEHPSDDTSWSPYGGPLSFQTFGVYGAPSKSDARGDKFSQEFRFNFPVSRYFDSLVGLFYTHEYSSYAQSILGTDPQTGKVYGVGYYAANPSTYRESAIFANLTYHLTSNLDLQLGARQSWNKTIQEPFLAYAYGAYLTSFYGPGVTSPIPNPGIEFSESPLTYLFTAQYKISPNAMVYGRLATGYRQGGLNSALPGVPPTFDSDSTKNYEIGTKSDLFSGVLSVDASIYYIDWNKIQVPEQLPQAYDFAGYVGNAGRAKSQGLDLSVELRPAKGLQISAWGAWDEAKITELPPSCTVTVSATCLPTYSTLAGTVGQVLPWTPRFSAHLSVTQDFAVINSLTFYVGGEFSYIGDRKDVFTGVDPNGLPAYRQDLPAYTKTDFRLGIKSSAWSGNLYVNNATNERGMISGGTYASNNPPGSTYLIKPRAVGVTVVRQF